MGLLLKLFMNPRVLIALALVALLSFTHMTAYRKGKANVRTEWLASVAAANAEARHLEQARQAAADSAVRLAAAREAGMRADAARAHGALGGLRDAVQSTYRRGEESAAAALATARVLGDLLQSCSAEYRSVAEEADRATSEALTLRQAWPK